MEPGYPVWTIRPNWSQGILERLEWLTDVIPAASSGAEQRRALRLSPRRYLEITVNPTRQERSYLDLVLHALGSETWLTPLWFDVGRLSADAGIGDNRVEFDTTFREHPGGEFALLFKDALTWEVVAIEGSDDTGLDLSAPVEALWPAGTQIFPLRKAVLPIETSISALTSNVGESVLMFQITESNDYTAAPITDPLFEAMPVLTLAPNRVEQIDLNHLRLSIDKDNSTGIPYRADPIGRAFQVQAHNWTVVGRQAHSAFRSLLYWLRGRQRSLWLPSFNDDVVASRPAILGAGALDIEKVGMVYAGGLIPGRDVIMVNGHGARISAVAAGLSSSEERLTIADGLPVAVASGDVGSFLSVSRLNQDAIELTHHTDTDGVMEAAATFQTFANTRDPSGAIYLPIPAAAMNADPCGTFDGVYLTILLEIKPVLGSSGTHMYYPLQADGWVSNAVTGPGFIKIGNAATRPVGHEPIPVPSDPPSGGGAGFDYAGTKFSFYMDPGVGVDHFLRLQFPWKGTWVNSSGQGNKARLRYRRWGEDDWTTAFPLSGDSMADGQGWFSVRGLWPDDWRFNF